MSTKPKYASYTELAAAFKSGELDKHYFFMLDKGGRENVLRYHNSALSDEDNSRKSDEAYRLFNGDRPVDELFEALGIRAEWC